MWYICSIRYIFYQSYKSWQSIWLPLILKGGIKMSRLIIEVLGGIILFAGGFIVGVIRERKGMNKDIDE